MLKSKVARLRKPVFVFIQVGLSCMFWLCYGVSFAEDAFVYASGDKRNPFIPLVTSDGKLLKLDVDESSNKGLAIEGIIFGKNGVSYAIMNGHVVKIGDFAGDAQVLKIGHDRVILIKDGQTSEVELKKGEE
jgi:hypothetical protein